VKTFQLYWRRLPEGLRLSIVYFSVTRLIFTLLGVATIKLVGHYSNAAHHVVFNYFPKFSGIPFLDMWAQWDSGWYLHIAQHGYQAIPDINGQTDIAFFPLYPYLIRILAWPFHYSLTAVLIIGLLISSAALIATGHFLYKFTAKKFSPKIARLTLLLLFLSPTGFIFSSIMTESLFLLFLVLAFMWAEQSRWKYVATMSALLVLTRPAGFPAVLVLGIMYAARNNFNWRRLLKIESLWVIGPLLGTACLLLINHAVTGDFLGFAHAEKAWQRGFFTLNGPSGGLLTLQGLYLLAFPLLALFLISRFRKKIGWEYGLLTVALLILPMLSGLYGLIRYICVIFPLYIALALLLESRKNWYEPLLITLLLFQGVHFVWWVLGMPIMQ
jgi:hypothetical protein